MRVSPGSSALGVGFILLVLTPSPGGEVPAFAKQIPASRSGPPTFSFNGKDLDGFYTFTRQSKYDDPNRVFTVHDGMIHVSGEEMGGLATRDSFADYRLIVEWKWGNRTWYPRRHGARNSGIMVHGVGLDGDALACWMESIECQLIEGGSGDLIVAPGKGKPPSLSSEVRIGADGQPYYHKGGEPKTLRQYRFNWWGRDPDWKDVLGFRGENDLENPVGEWNRMEVICDGDSITCILNGTLANAATRSSLNSGKITLQSEGAEIFFRKFEVRPLLK
jgi:3-keto-disaccharide hydrolase